MAARPAVRWGARREALASVVPATSRTFTVADLCGEPATADGWWPPGWIHSAVLSGLEPGARYIYQVGDLALGWPSDPVDVVAPPAAGSDDGRPVRLYAFGDLGQAELDGSWEESQMWPAINTTRRMLAGAAEAQLILHVGDISYAMGHATQWEVFHDLVAPLASRLPYMTSIGNHEADAPNSRSFFNSTDSGGTVRRSGRARAPA